MKLEHGSDIALLKVKHIFICIHLKEAPIYFVFQIFLFPGLLYRLRVTVRVHIFLGCLAGPRVNGHNKLPKKLKRNNHPKGPGPKGK